MSLTDAERAVLRAWADRDSSYHARIRDSVRRLLRECDAQSINLAHMRQRFEELVVAVNDAHIGARATRRLDVSEATIRFLLDDRDVFRAETERLQSELDGRIAATMADGRRHAKDIERAEQAETLLREAMALLTTGAIPKAEWCVRVRAALVAWPDEDATPYPGAQRCSECGAPPGPRSEHEETCKYVRMSKP